MDPNEAKEEKEVKTNGRSLVDISTVDNDDSSTDTNDSSFFLNPSSSAEQAENEGIGLLRQIFPDEPTETLREMHHQHIQNNLTLENEKNQKRKRLAPEVDLPDDFLRLPTSVAVRRSYTNAENGASTTRYEFIADLEKQCLQDHFISTNDGNSSQLLDYFTAVVEPQPGGLGLKLQQEYGWLVVHDLLDWKPNPSADAGILPGDVLIGINGYAFVNYTTRQAVESVQTSPIPVVLHFRRRPVRSPTNAAVVERTTSLLDNTILEEAPTESILEIASITPPPSQPLIPRIHPFATALSKRRLIQSHQDECLISSHLYQFTERARQWESLQAFRIHPTSYKLIPQFDPKDLPPDMAKIMCIEDENEKVKFVPSTPPLRNNSPLIPLEYIHAFYGDQQQITMEARQNRPQESSQTTSQTKAPVTNHYPAIEAARAAQQMLPSLREQRQEPLPTIFIPLYGIRKALSARIVHSFVDEQGERAYTIWVYDVESGKEWYAPMRYWEDFAELRTATLALDHSGYIRDLDFPNKGSGWLFRTAKKATNKEAQRQQALEAFLRGLCRYTYTCQPLHPQVAELAIHVQSFLGTEAALAEVTDLEETRISSTGPEHPHWYLKKSIQRYTWRLFLLQTPRAMVQDFVDIVKQRAPKLTDLEKLEAQGRASLKARAMQDLEYIQSFLDQLVDLIVEGSLPELREVAKRREYPRLDEATWERLVREAVREQVEIEVYVPLRSVVSRLLVNGWKHEDMEVQFKIKVRYHEYVVSLCFSHLPLSTE